MGARWAGWKPAPRCGGVLLALAELDESRASAAGGFGAEAAGGVGGEAVGAGGGRFDVFQGSLGCGEVEEGDEIGHGEGVVHGDVGERELRVGEVVDEGGAESGGEMMG